MMQGMRDMAEMHTKPTGGGRFAICAMAVIFGIAGCAAGSVYAWGRMAARDLAALSGTDAPIHATTRYPEVMPVRKDDETFTCTLGWDAEATVLGHDERAGILVRVSYLGLGISEVPGCKAGMEAFLVSPGQWAVGPSPSSQRTLREAAGRIRGPATGNAAAP